MSKNKTKNELIDNPKTIGTLVYLGIMGAIMFYLLPLFVGALANEMSSLSINQLGIFASSDLTGLCLSSLTAFLWIRVISWRKMALLGILLIVGGNILAIFANEFELLLITRIIAGFGQGILMSITLAGLNDSDNPDGYVGFYITGSTLMAAIGFLVFDDFFSYGGLDVLWSLLAGITIIGLIPAFYWLPSSSTPVERTSIKSDIKLNYVPAILILAGLFFNFFGNAGVWAFAERLGNNIGLSMNFIGKSLSISLFVSLLGSMLPFWLKLKWGRLLPITLGIIVNIFTIALLFIGQTSNTYFIAVLLYFFSLNFLTPYVIGAIGSYDTNGKIIVLVAPTYSIANALGPVVVGFLIINNNFMPVAYLGIGIIFLSFIFFAFALKRFKSKTSLITLMG